MLRDDAHWLALTDKFHSAAVDGSWYSALAGLAEATGSRSGQLIMIGPDAAVPVNIITDIDPALVAEFEAVGGGDPGVNPRVAAGMGAPVLKTLAECDFFSEDEWKNNAHYREFVFPLDIPFICLTTLERWDSLLIGLSVTRSKRNGHITPEQRRVFETVAPHVRAAVRTQTLLDNHGAALVTGTLEALAVPAFICDGRGYVKALTPAAEALVASGRGLQLRQGRLHATDADAAMQLHDAIDATRYGRHGPGEPAQRTVVVRGIGGDLSPVVLEVLPLPTREYQFAFSPRVLIVARGAKSAGERAAILQAAYALTPAETEVALELCDGRRAEAIAASRAVSVGTVRVQIKSILAKVGVRGQSELVARLHQH